MHAATSWRHKRGKEGVYQSWKDTKDRQERQAERRGRTLRHGGPVKRMVSCIVALTGNDAWSLSCLLSLLSSLSR